MENTVCQLYQYNSSFYLIKKETPAHFALEFSHNVLDDDHVSWLNFNSLAAKNDIVLLCQQLKIEKLSIENIFIEVRRPKVEETNGYIYFNVISALPSTKSDNELLIKDQITFFLGKDYLISFQSQEGDHFDDVRDRIEKNRGKIRSKKSDFLLFRALEAIVDNYFEVVDSIAKKTTRIDEFLRKSEDKSLLLQIEVEKRKLIELRKLTSPMLEISVQLLGSETNLIEENTRRYFSSLNHSCSHVITEIDSQKQILDGMANFYYAAQGQRMNEIMKVLTVISSIFIPLTFIAGVYGMNFDNIPELKFKNGYFVVVGVMFVLGLLLFLFFVSRGWLRKKDYSNEN